MSDNPYKSAIPSEHPIAEKRQSKFAWIMWTILVIGIFVFLMGLLLPGRRISPEAARRSQCKNNLHLIVEAMHEYHAEHGSYPPAYTVDDSGRPMHSWRTLILPYMKESEAADLVNLSVSWNSPENRAARDSSNPFYQCPTNDLESYETTYHVVVTEDSCIQPVKSLSQDDIPETQPPVILVIEMPKSSKTHWMEPSVVSAEQLLEFVAGDQSAIHFSVVHFANSANHVDFAVLPDMPTEELMSLIRVDREDLATGESSP